MPPSGAWAAANRSSDSAAPDTRDGARRSEPAACRPRRGRARSREAIAGSSDAWPSRKEHEEEDLVHDLLGQAGIGLLELSPQGLSVAGDPIFEGAMLSTDIAEGARV